LQPPNEAGPLDIQDRLAARPTSVAPLAASTQGGHRPSPYCWYGTTAAPVRTFFCRPPPVGDLQPQQVINLPFWSTLMLEFDAC
jgi:hypothetical protein